MTIQGSIDEDDQQGSSFLTGVVNGGGFTPFAALGLEC